MRKCYDIMHTRILAYESHARLRGTQLAFIALENNNFTSPTTITMNAQHYSSNNLKTSCRSQNPLRRQRPASGTSLQSVNTSFRSLFTGAPGRNPAIAELIASFTTIHLRNATSSISSLRVLNLSTYAKNYFDFVENFLSLRPNLYAIVPRCQKTPQTLPRN